MPDYDDNGSSNEQSIVEIPQQQQHSSLRQSRQWTFQNALKWVHPLHVQYHDHQSSSSGGASTLAALVPVHHCLLQTALQVSTECRDSSAADLAMKLGEESNNTHQYHAQFNSTNTINDAERLLWVQYRLATAVAARRKGISSLPSPVGTETSSSHDTLLLVPEELLVAQVLPLLFPGRPNPSTGSHPEATIDNKNKEEPKWTGASDELLDAMLDALWLFRDPHCEESSKAYRIIDESTRNIQSNTSSDDDDGARKMTVVSLRNDDGARKKTLVSLRLHWLTKCVDFIVTGLTTAAPSLSSSSSRRTWSMSCRILVQLSRWMDNNDGKIGNNTEEKEHLVAAAGAVVVIRQALVELVRWGIHLALASPTTSTSTATTQLATEFLPLEEDFNPSPDSNCNECFSIRDGEDDALDIPAILGPLVRDVLPALLSKSNECLMPTGNGNDMMPFVYDVWGIVWAAYFTSLTSEENNKLLFLQSKATTGLTCLTTILCSIVPSLLDRKLPLVTATTSKNDMIENGADTENKATRVLPLHNEPLWTVIQHCLNQGLTIHFDSIRKRRSCPNQSSTDPLSIDDALETAAVSSSLQMDQLCRRRGMYLLRLLVSQYSMETTATAQSNTSSVTPVQDWFKFVDCFETVEMEQEQHLIDQLWATITELFESMSHTSGQEKETAAAHTNQLPRLSWDWMKLLLGRMLVSQNSPVLRKLCLYRLLQGQAGISIASDLTPANNDENTINSTSENSTMPIRKSKFRSKHSKEVAIVMPQRCGVSLDVVTVEFLFTVIIPSFDTLCTSVGTNMQGSEAMLAGIKKQKGGNESSSKVAICYDMVQLLCDFICVYLSRSIKEAEIQRDTSNVEEFFRRLWSVDVVDGIHDKYTVHIFEAIGQMLEKRKQQGKQSECIPVHDEMLKDVAESFRLSFSDGSVVQVYQTALLQALATMLECSTTLGQYSPQSVLGILALYPVSHLEKSTMAHRGPLTEKNEADTPSWIDADSALSSLRTWLTATNVSITSSGTVNVGAVLGTAFVDGTLMSSMTTLENSNWHPRRGCTQLECKMAKAIGLFCTLPHFVASDKSTTTAGALLWPAIYKGLSNAPGAMIGSSWSRADKVSRSLLLLENGVKLRVLSGMGNGDLVVDKVTKQMMPPPPNIEAILTNGVSFIIHHMRSLVELPTAADRVGAVLTSRGSRSDDARLLSSTFAYLVEQLHSLATGFMSSMAVSEAIEVLLQNNVSTLLDGNKNNDANTMPLIALIFAALSCGGEIPSSITLSVSTIILQSHFDRALQANGSLQASRSVFQYVKWGAISCLVPTLCQLSQTEENRIELQGFMRDLFDVAVESVEATPANTIVPVFASVISAAHACLLVNPPIIVEEQPIPKVVSALFGLLDACDNSNDAMHMMDDMCSLLFQPTLLLNEYTRLEQHPECETPIRDSFRRLVAMAGTQRPHIYRVVLSHICAGWLSGNDPGLTSIPYRDDIADLLVLKEDLIPVASAFMEVGQQQSSFTKKRETHETSIAREFILVFLSKLPHENSGLAPKVLHELLHPVMKQLMQLVTRPPPSGATLIMLGTPEYCIKARSLQALCIMSRFFTAEVADFVCLGVIQAMGKQNAHNQLRYFVEILTLQFARMHPAVFGKVLVKEIGRTDLSLQMAASLMIVAGNLIVGRYEKDFFAQYENESDTVSLHAILAGVMPWLSSTQGFTRAIAQLLVYKLIPMLVDVSDNTCGNDSNWYLKSMYHFLDTNPEMKRLRQKQAKFFERYEVDPVCTPEGVLAIPVDESNEANPVHLVDVIKDCLQEVYLEANIDRTPMWRQLQSAVESLPTEPASTANELHLSNMDALHAPTTFQRKIVPIDTLNLALEDVREQRLRNVAGRRKQNLIVCASLIDKIPNLGGLARTCEIFAAQRLIVPDLSLTKMDNFKSLCVGAGDWIDMEECKEHNLLGWLRDHKEKGYFIVGLEQTSSSVSLSSYTFPTNPTSRSAGAQQRQHQHQPTILLLGKEKEGIPVEFLQAVDQCLEIPQLGIIRSLNVHVSAAIAIWEFSKQNRSFED